MNNHEIVETPVRFGRHDALVGVSCLGREGVDNPFVLFINAGIVHRVGPNRLYVLLARALATRGFSSLRFDLSGIGDSGRPHGGQAGSIQEQVEEDIEDALALAEQQFGASRFVLIGLCSGADNALRTMARDPRVVGSALLDLNAPRTRGFYLREYGPKVVSARSWLKVLTGRPSILERARTLLARDDSSGTAADESLEHDAFLPPDLMEVYLRQVVDRDGKLLCVFTPGLDAYNHHGQFLRAFPSIDFSACLCLHYFPDADHTFSTEALRSRLIRTVVEWIDQTRFPAGTASGGAYSRLSPDLSSVERRGAFESG